MRSRRAVCLRESLSGDIAMLQRRHQLFTAALTLVLVFFAQWANAQEADAQAVFDKAAGYAVFRVTKGGLGASGAGGNGVAVDKATGKRTYMRMGSAGVGLTVGVSRYNIVILFETQEKFDAFVRGGWDSAATAQAAAGTSGAQVSSTFFDGVAYYQLGRRGLMASADVSGTRFWAADELN